MIYPTDPYRNKMLLLKYLSLLELRGMGYLRGIPSRINSSTCTLSRSQDVTLSVPLGYYLSHIRLRLMTYLGIDNDIGHVLTYPHIKLLYRTSSCTSIFCNTRTGNIALIHVQEILHSFSRF